MKTKQNVVWIHFGLSNAEFVVLGNLRKRLGLFLQCFDKLFFGLQIFLDLAQFQHGCPVVPAVVSCLQLGLSHLDEAQTHT